MAQRTVGTGTTSEITAGNQVAFSLRERDFKYGRPVVSVGGLADTETVSFWIWVGSAWEELTDDAGIQIAFTATDNSDVFNGPGTYGFTKDATAGAITVHVERV